MINILVGIGIGFIICLLIVLINKSKSTPLQKENKLPESVTPTEKSEQLWRKDFYRVEYEERFTQPALTYPIIGHDSSLQYRAKIFKNGKLVHTSNWYDSKNSADSYADFFIKCDAEKYRKPHEWIDIVKIK